MGEQHMIEKVNIRKRMGQITEYWQPNTVEELNGQYPKLSVSFTRSLASSLTCKSKKIYDYKCFPLKMLQVSGAKRRLRANKTLRDFHFIPNLQALRCPM